MQNLQRFVNRRSREKSFFDPITRVQHVQVATFVETQDTKTAREVGDQFGQVSITRQLGRPPR